MVAIATDFAFPLWVSWAWGVFYLPAFDADERIVGSHLYEIQDLGGIQQITPYVTLNFTFVNFTTFSLAMILPREVGCSCVSVGT